MGGLNLNKAPGGAGTINKQPVLDSKPNDSADSILNDTTQVTGRAQTADEAGIDIAAAQDPNASPENAVADLERNIGAAQAGINTKTQGKTYSSHPVQNFAIGPFQFVKGVMTLLEGEAIDAFEELLDALPAPDRLMIKTVDLGKAEEIAANFLRGGATKQFDSSVGRAAMEKLAQQQQTIGDTDIEAPFGRDDAGNPLPNPADNPNPGQ